MLDTTANSETISIAQLNNINSDTEDENTNDNNKINKLIIDENSNNSENSFKFNSKTKGNSNKRSLKQAVAVTQLASNFERKRTANLENVIGNLINRKRGTGSNSATNTSSTLLSSNNNDDVTAIEYAFSQPLSPSTSSTSSSLSQHSSISPSSSPKLSKKNLHEKQKWSCVETPTTTASNNKATSDLINLIHAVASKNYDNNNVGSADSANGTASSPSSTRCDQDSDILKEHMSTPVSSCASDNGHPPSPLNGNALNEYTNIFIQNGSKAKGGQTRQTNKANDKLNIEDPTRQIKFYDDYIDFRGDILKRPAGAKNCRILWEYLYILLQDNHYNAIIRWEDSVQMVFRIVQAEKLAALWGLQKNRLGMTYEKLSRGMRYYYPNNIIAREPGRRLLYRFMRHPDDIKKSVKKNGTYMLKRAKMELKNGKTDSTVATAIVPPSNNKKTSKSFNEDECEDESLIDEFEDEAEDEIAKKTNDNDSGLDETPTISPVPEKKQKFDNKFINNDHSDNRKKKPINKKNNEGSQQLLQQSSTVNNQNLAQHFYPNLYPFLTAQMVAALQQPQQQTSNMFVRNTNNDEVLAAHFLMQLRNQNNDGLGFSGQNNNLLNLQQIFSNTNESFLQNNNNNNNSQRAAATLPIKSTIKLAKQEDQSTETSIKIKTEFVNNTDNNDIVNKKSPSNKINGKISNGAELPLNLCVNNNKKLNIKKEKTSENSTNDINSDQNQCDEIDNE